MVGGIWQATFFNDSCHFPSNITFPVVHHPARSEWGTVFFLEGQDGVEQLSLPCKEENECGYLQLQIQLPLDTYGGEGIFHVS